MLSYQSFGVGEVFDPDRSFVRSSIVSPFVLGCIRACISLYIFTTIRFGYSWQAVYTATTDLRDVNIPVYSISTHREAIGYSFLYLTWLTFWSLGFYFLVSAIHTFHYSRYHTTWLHNSWPRYLQLAHSLWYTSITCLPFLVSITFWGTMYSRVWPTSLYEQWINISVHALNTLFALIEVTLPSTSPFPVASHLSVLLLVLSLYLALAYLTRLTQGFYVYAWLNPFFGWQSIVLHVLVYTGAIIAIFFVVRAIIGFRKSRGDRCTLNREERRRIQMRAGRRCQIRPTSETASEGGWSHLSDDDSLWNQKTQVHLRERSVGRGIRSLDLEAQEKYFKKHHFGQTSLLSIEKISPDYHRRWSRQGRESGLTLKSVVLFPRKEAFEQQIVVGRQEIGSTVKSLELGKRSQVKSMELESIEPSPRVNPTPMPRAYLGP